MRPLLVALVCTALATSGAAPATAPPAETTSTRSAGPAGPGFGAPLAGPLEVARPFDLPDSGQVWYGPGHRGVDLLGGVDAPVLAAGSGRVVYAGPLAERPVLSVAHNGGLRTTYEPVDPVVEVGDRVGRAQPIGRLRLGHRGCRPPPGQACLHWGVRRGETYLDPLRLLGGGAVRLLPWPSDDTR